MDVNKTVYITTYGDIGVVMDCPHCKQSSDDKFPFNQLLKPSTVWKNRLKTKKNWICEHCGQSTKIEIEANIKLSNICVG